MNSPVVSYVRCSCSENGPENASAAQGPRCPATFFERDLLQGWVKGKSIRDPRNSNMADNTKDYPEKLLRIWPGLIFLGKESGSFCTSREEKNKKSSKRTFYWKLFHLRIVKARKI